MLIDFYKKKRVNRMDHNKNEFLNNDGDGIYTIECMTYLIH
jgi:hypothetical protein